MSLAADSPVNSSSSDDFAAFLDEVLDSKSSDSSGVREAEIELGTHSSDSLSDEEAEDELGSDSLNLIPHSEDKDDYGLEDKRVKRSKVEKSENMEEPKGTTDLSFEQNSEASSSKAICIHPGSFGNMCIICGQRLDEESGVTFGYIHKGLRLGDDEIARLRNTDMKNLLQHRKLYLILDLDHTLLNSTLLFHMTSEEEYLKSQVDSLQDISKGSLFKLDFMNLMTKLRPFVRTFLKEASQMFEMYIYTMGDRNYALEMAKLLDPSREYFSARVISRDDGTQKHQKGLDVVLGQESFVLILDDTETAWSKHKENLILMERYHFFASSCHQFGVNYVSLSEQKRDESEADGALATVLKVLRKIHQIFFEELTDNLDGRDVRPVLKTVRKDVLKGCKIVFTRVFPTHFRAENHYLWKMAEQLGAECATETDPSVTHVVSTDAGTEKSKWAIKENKFLVRPDWIEATNYLWEKQPEEKFMVNQKKGE